MAALSEATSKTMAGAGAATSALWASSEESDTHPICGNVVQVYKEAPADIKARITLPPSTDTNNAYELERALRGVEELDLSGLGLTSLPSQLFEKLVNVHKLNLSNNALTSLIGLEDTSGVFYELNVSNNSLTSLKGLNRTVVHHVRSLDLSNNLFRVLSGILGFISDAARLQKLNLTNLNRDGARGGMLRRNIGNFILKKYIEPKLKKSIEEWARIKGWDLTVTI